MPSLDSSTVPFGAVLRRPVDVDAMFRLGTLLAVSRCLYPLWPCAVPTGESLPAVPSSGGAAARLWDFLRTADAGGFLGRGSWVQGSHAWFMGRNSDYLLREYLHPVVRAADDKIPDLGGQVRSACHYRVWWTLFNRAMQQLVDAPAMLPYRYYVGDRVSCYALSKCRGRDAVPLDGSGLLTYDDGNHGGWIDSLTYGTLLSQVTCCNNDYDQTRESPLPGSPILPTLADEWLETFLGYAPPTGTPGVLRAMWRRRCNEIGLGSWLPDDWDSRKSADGATYADMVKRAAGARRAPWRGDTEPSYSRWGPADEYLTQLLSPWTGRGTVPGDPDLPAGPFEWDTDFPYHGLCALQSLLEHMEADSAGLMSEAYLNLERTHYDTGERVEGVVYTDRRTDDVFSGGMDVAVRVHPPGAVADDEYVEVELAGDGPTTLTSTRRSHVGVADDVGWSRDAGASAGEPYWPSGAPPYVRRTLNYPRVWGEVGEQGGYTVYYDLSDLDAASAGFWWDFFLNPDFADPALVPELFFSRCVSFIGIDRKSEATVHVSAGAMVSVQCRGYGVAVDSGGVVVDPGLSPAVTGRTDLVKHRRHVFFLKTQHNSDDTEPPALATRVSPKDPPDTYILGFPGGTAVNGPHACIYMPTAEDEVSAAQSALVKAVGEAERRSAAALATYGYLGSNDEDPDSEDNMFYRPGGARSVPVAAKLRLSPCRWTDTPEMPSMDVSPVVWPVVVINGTDRREVSGPIIGIGDWGAQGEESTGSGEVSASAAAPSASLEALIYDDQTSHSLGDFVNGLRYRVPVVANADTSFVSVYEFEPGRIS